MANTIKIATNPEWYPESGECSVDGFERRKYCRPGYGPEILDFVLRYIKHSYEIVEMPRSKQGGQLIDRINGIYDGALGDIQQGLYDTVAAPFTINAERYTIFDFTTPIFPLESMFVVGPHEPTFIESSLKLFTIFHPILTVSVLISLGAILVGLIITHSHAKHDQISKNDSIGSKLDQFIADASKQRFFTGKVQILLFGGTLAFFTKLYESCLLTFLVLPPEPVHMTQTQLLDRVYRKELTFVIDENDYNTHGHWTIIRYSKEEKYRKFQEALNENPPFFFDGNLKSLVKIFEENPTKYVYFGDTDYANWLKGTDSGCKLRSIKMDNSMIFWAGFIFRKNSTWVKKLNEGINRNLRYIYAMNEQYYSENITNCVYNGPHVEPLGFQTVLGCFTWLFVGFTFAILSLLFEVLYERSQRSKIKLNLFICTPHAFFTRQQNRPVEFGDIDFIGAQRFNLKNQWFRDKRSNDVLP